MRKLRVYAPDGGFTIEIPDGCRVTMGYFNPSAAGKMSDPYSGSATKTAKATALRIYKKTGPKTEDQIACFLGVDGFRDMETTYHKLSYNEEL